VVDRDGSEDDFEGPCVSHNAGEAWKRASLADVTLEGEESRQCLLVVGVGSEAVDGSDGLYD